MNNKRAFFQSTQKVEPTHGGGMKGGSGSMGSSMVSRPIVSGTLHFGRADFLTAALGET